MFTSPAGRGLIALGLLLVAAPAARAQYFGGNKVQYENLDFQVLRTPHFDIHYYSSERDAVQHAARMAERWYARLARALDHEFTERHPLVFYTSHSDFRQTTIVRGVVPEGVGGVTEHLKGRIAMPFAVGLGETDHVLGHELAHAFQREILERSNRSIGLLPSWFIEGMAEYLSLGRIDTQTAIWLRDAALDERLPSLAELDDPRWFPYRFGQALWSYLAQRFGEDVVARALDARGSAIRRITSVTGVDAGTLTRDWHREIARVYGGAEGGEGQRPSAATRILGGPAGPGRLHLAPALSPDGRRVAFLSERDAYSVDLYVADAASGAIERRLVRTATAPRFDSVQFIASAGAWDASGTRFALATIQRGRPVISIIDTASARTEREIALPDLDEAFNPSWSPDGRQIVVSAMRGGQSDIYVVEVDTGSLRALTSDPFADLYPAWAPDGGRILFSTERFSSSLETLSFGHYRLATVDAVTGEVEALPSLPQVQHTDPHWSADAASVFFIGAVDGRRNVYRLDLATAAFHRLTDVPTGVSGITALSPALSVARNTDRMAFSLFRHGAYELHILREAAGDPVIEPVAGLEPARPPGGALAPPAFGLTDGTDFVEQPYDAGLRLNRIGQPYLTAGGGSFGTFLRAGVSFTFEDLLGEHSLRTAVQVGTSRADLGLQAGYVNRQSRLNWAVVGEQVPLLFAVSRSSIEPAAGGPALATEDVRIRQMHRQLGASAIYPFSRTTRLEVGGALHAIDVSRTVESASYSTATGALLSEARVDSGISRALVYESSAALVRDTAVHGPTSPVLGARARIDVASNLGDLRFTTVSADYRRYDMVRRPFTLAMRVRHTGRYGPDASDSRLLPLGQNVAALVRGHSRRSLTSRTCAPGADGECDPSRYFATTRLLLANLELRFPVLGALRGGTSYGPVPVEAFLFGDSAWLWTPRGAADNRSDRIGLASAGAGLRVNVRHFVFEAAAARPFDAPEPRWRLAFNLRRGF